MKYPAKQFEVIVSTLKALSEVFELDNVHPSSLYSLVCSQHNKGQQHNRIVVTCDGVYMNQHIADSRGVDYTPIVEPFDNFETYPSGCNDSHIQTAVKKALTLI